jgi:flagellar motor switch protein FliN/FliY
MEEAVEPVQDQLLFEVLLASLTASLGSLSGAEWKSSLGDASAPEEERTRAAIAVALRGTLHGRLLVRAVVDEVLAAVPIEEDSASPTVRWVRDAIERWRVSSTESLFEAEIGEDGDEPIEGNRSSVRFAAEDGRQISVQIVCSAELMAAFAQARVAGSSEVEAAEMAPAEAMNLELVLDVELNVVLRFGQRQLTLREVLDLTSGSVIELDRQVEEPVELLLDGKVIARGEAVVIDGNYGLRVTEVPQAISPAMLPHASLI